MGRRLEDFGNLDDPRPREDDIEDCTICGLPMYYGPSMSGDRICGWCDSGHNRDNTKWDFAQTVLMIGRGSVFGRPCEGCTRVKGHPGGHTPSKEEQNG